MANAKRNSLFVYLGLDLNQSYLLQRALLCWTQNQARKKMERLSSFNFASEMLQNYVFQPKITEE